MTVTGPRTYRAAVPAGTTVRGAEVVAVAAQDKLDRALDRTGVTPVVVRESGGLVELMAVLDGASAAGSSASPAVAYIGPAPVAITPEDESTPGSTRSTRTCAWSGPSTTPTATASSRVDLFERAVKDALGLDATIWNASWTSGEDGDPDAVGIQPFVMAFVSSFSSRASPHVAGAAALILDLELVAPDGTVYRGNNFDRGWSVAGGEADRLEVLANVYVQKPQAGTWTVRVRAHALPGGVRWTADMAPTRTTPWS